MSTESNTIRMFGGFVASLVLAPASIMIFLPTAMKFFGVAAIKAAAASATLATISVLGLTLTYTILAYREVNKPMKKD